MNIWTTFILPIISGGLAATAVSAFISHWSNKKMDIQQRTMEIRKDLYTKIINQISFFISTVSEEDSDNARDDLLKYFRELQIWGSDKVVRQFRNLINLMCDKSSIEEKKNLSDKELVVAEEKRNLSYKELVVALRFDILGKTNITPEEIDIRGIVK